MEVVSLHPIWFQLKFNYLSDLSDFPYVISSFTIESWKINNQIASVNDKTQK